MVQGNHESTQNIEFETKKKSSMVEGLTLIEQDGQREGSHCILNPPLEFRLSQTHPYQHPRNNV